MADSATLLGLSPRRERHVSEWRSGRTGRGNYVDMLVVRKADLKIRDGFLTFWRLVKDLSRIRKRMPRAVSRSWIRMTDRTDHGSRTTEKLLPVTVKAGLMLWIIGDIRKGGGTCSHLVPIRRRKLMAGSTLKFVGLRIVRKGGILCSLRSRPRWRASSSLG